MDTSPNRYKIDYAHGKVIIELTGHAGNHKTSVSCEGMDDDIRQSILIGLKREFKSDDLVDSDDFFIIPGNQVEAIKTALELEPSTTKNPAKNMKVTNTARGAVIIPSYNATLTTSTMTNMKI